MPNTTPINLPGMSHGGDLFEPGVFLAALDTARTKEPATNPDLEAMERVCADLDATVPTWRRGDSLISAAYFPRHVAEITYENSDYTPEQLASLDWDAEQRDVLTGYAPVSVAGKLYYMSK